MKEKIIVTGSNGQLGRALIDMLIEQKYEVIGIDIDYEDKEEAVSGISKIPLDITCEESVENFFSNFNVSSAPVGLINNAGIAVFSDFEERTYEEIKSVLDVNIFGTINMTKNFMKLNRKSKFPLRVVNLGSIYGEIAPDLNIYGDTPRMSSEIYGMSKAAIINFTKYLASKYKDTNARFNCVSPGGISFNQGPKFIEKYSAKVPLNRMAEVGEIAEVICFLISKKSSYVNGENIFVDGGLTKW